MKTLLILLTLVLSLGFAQVPSAVIVAGESVVQLVDESGRGYCSGSVLALAEGNRIVTAGHCVEGKTTVIVSDLAGRTYLASVERTVFDEKVGLEDWAVLSSSAAYLLPALPVAKEPLTLGESVYVFACPLGLRPLLFQGYYSGMFASTTETKTDMGGLGFLTLNGDGGSSGSILLNSRGEAFGITVIGLSEKVKLQGLLFVPLSSFL